MANPLFSEEALARAASHSEPFVTHAYVFWTAAAVYLPLVWVGRAYMRTRPPFSLRPVLVAWNTTLAILSVLVVKDLLPYAVSALSGNGVRGW
jgi:hypothetical protein